MALALDMITLPSEPPLQQEMDSLYIAAEVISNARKGCSRILQQKLLLIATLRE